jgi:uncharacterized membrane protein YfcA
MTIAAALVAPVGVWFLGVLSQELARLLASIMILVFVMMALLRKTTGETINRPMVLRAGALSGFMGGVAGMTGPPVVALLLRMRLGPCHPDRLLCDY